MVIVSKSLKTNAAVAAIVGPRKPKSFDGFMGSGEKLLAAIVTIGLAYKTTNAKIAQAKLILKQADLKDKNAALLLLFNLEKEALIARNAAYLLMFVLTTDSLSALRSSEDVSAAQILTAVNLAKKEKGVRIGKLKKEPVIAAGTAAVVTSEMVADAEKEVSVLRKNSVSHQQFESRAGNFLAFITYTTGQSCYSPDNARLSATALKAYYATLGPLNSTAETAMFNSDKGRNERNETFFNNTTGARFLYTQVKNYFKSFGTKSVEYKMVKGLAFSNLIAKKYRTPTTSY